MSETTFRDKEKRKKEDFLPRQTAFHISIARLKQGKYHKGEGYNPNYILLDDSTKVSRCNIIAVVVSIPTDIDNNVLIDDGTEKISLRTFEAPSIFDKVTIGDVILVIGKPREYNDEIYIIPEIIKKIKDNGWVLLRKKELALHVLKTKNNQPEQKEENMRKKVEKDDSSEHMENPTELPSEIKDVYGIIKNLDTGEGADTQEVIKKFPGKNTEKIITNLLLEGEIFEIKPGRLKVLE